MSEPWRPRVALVVGVMSYSAKPLNNAVTDADSVTKLLEAHGFEIISVEPDPTRDELLSAIFMLQNRVSQLNIKGPSHGCVAVFYYAGHGLLGDSGTHYMLGSDWKTSLPTVGKLTVSQALQLYGVELSEALDSMKDAYAGIALVDACQELCDDAHGSSAAATRHLGDLNCSSPSSAAAELSEQLPKQLTRGWGGDAIGKSHLSQNLLVAHACAPQHTASDGLGQGAFTSCLLKELCNPAHRHVLDAILDVNIKVFQETRRSTIPQQPRLDVSAPPGLFDTFKLAQPVVKLGASHLRDEQRAYPGLLEQLTDPKPDPKLRLKAAKKLLCGITDGEQRSSLTQLLVDLGGVPLLVGVLKDKDLPRQLYISMCSILQVLAKSSEYRDRLAAKGLAPLLLQDFAANAEAPDKHQAAWSVLECLLESKAARVSMYLQGGLQQLATCLGGLCPDTSDRDTTADLDAIEEAVSDPKYATRALCLLVGMLSNHCYMAAARRAAAENAECCGLRSCLDFLGQPQSGEAAESGFKDSNGTPSALQLLLDKAREARALLLQQQQQ